MHLPPDPAAAAAAETQMIMVNLNLTVTNTNVAADRNRHGTAPVVAAGSDPHSNRRLQEAPAVTVSILLPNVVERIQALRNEVDHDRSRVDRSKGQVKLPIKRSKR